MTCPRCQADNRAGVRFCEECGARLEEACPHCSAPVVPGKRFCGACGGALGGAAPAAPPVAAERFAGPQDYTPRHLAEKILTSRAALEGERKQVTILFADLKGSMELLADRDPEEARRVLDPVLERMMEAVHRYEGTVNQVMGDGIMALFGAPLAHEDHAVRACYAALRMQETVGWYAEELRRHHGLDVQIRVGLNSGEVVVRSIGSDLKMDYTAVGQTTHLAARMEQLARPGSILLTGQTLRLAEGFVEVKPLGPVPVKGLAEAVEVFEILRAGLVRTRLQASAARGLTPFVGREAELRQLREAQERTAAGHGQVVAVVGEPGVGKSRLFWEFTHSHRLHGWLTLEAGSVSYGRLTAYLPVIELLKGYFRIEERDDARRIREKVTGKILTLDETLRPTLPVFLSLLDVPVEDPEWQAPDPPRRRQWILDAIKRLLLRESRVQPVLLIVESLHWVDAETQAFLDGLTESLPGARVLLLVNYRPEYRHAWGSRSYYRQIRLDPLPPPSAEQLLAALVGTDPGLDPVKTLLIQQTEGNPLFLEECVRTLVETQVLAGDRGAYRVARPLTGIQMPPTVQAVLAARIDRLSPEDKRLLQAASVVGREAPVALLRAVADLPEDALRQGLARLQAAEFVYETGLFPDLAYTFTHALTHDVAYGSLLHERRRVLHARILEAMERLYPDRRLELAEVLAEHAWRGEVWNRALVHLRQAAAKAVARSANREAVAGLERALSALGRLPEGRESTEQAIDVRLELRQPLLQLGDLHRVLALSQQAENLARLIGDESRLARVYTYLINYHYLIGDPDQAIAYGERTLAIGEAQRDVALAALARGYMGYSYHAQGRYREAEAVLLRNVEELEPARTRDASPQTVVSYVSSAGWLGFTLAELGDFELAQTYAAMAHRAAEQSRHAYSQAIAGALGGLVALARGHLDRAREQLGRSLDLCRQKDLTVWRPIPSSLLGLALVHLGRSEEGLPLLEDGVRLTEEMGVKAYLALWTLQWAEGLRAAGRFGHARDLAQRGLDLAVAHKERGHQARALRLVGDVALAQGDAGRAERSLSQALALTEELGMGPLGARCRLDLGRVHREAGRRQKAEDQLFEALGLFRQMDMRYWVDQAMTELKALGHLFVVAHYNLGLYEFLKDRLAGDPGATVVLDRRAGERRSRSRGATPSERRQSDRRDDRRTRDAALKSRGVIVVPGPGAGRHAPPPQPPAAG